jgi:hypothetical protein
MMIVVRLISSAVLRSTNWPQKNGTGGMRGIANSMLGKIDVHCRIVRSDEVDCLKTRRRPRLKDDVKRPDLQT